MCGIVGIVRNDKSDVDQALLARMCGAIRHRGPDDDGFYVNGAVGHAGRRTVEEKYSANVQAPRVFEVLRSVVADAGREREPKLKSQTTSV